MTEKELIAEVEKLKLLVEAQQELIDFMIDRVKVLAMKNQISFKPPNEKGEKQILDSYI